MRTLSYNFQNEDFLETALTHRSASKKNNERLEYLGDSILNFIIAEALFDQFSDYDEGILSRMRSSLVKQDSLADIGRDLKLGDYLKLGVGELKSGGFQRDSILADAVEAIIAAIYLDSDFETCKKIVLDLFSEKLKTIPLDLHQKDAKTRLQEYLQARQLSLPKYDIIKTVGEGHEQRFFVRCVISDLKHESIGEGSSHRRAEQAAAENYLRDYLQ
jgi:ribonuclease-3